MRENKLFLILFVGFFAQPCFAQTNLTDVLNGRPTLESKKLGPDTYVEFKAKHLNQAKVVYVNLALLQDKGINIPEAGVTPEFLQEFIDLVAWAVPNPNDASQLFSSEEKSFFADRYGGIGIGFNLGSGRAASNGIVQLKGIGRTPLVSPNMSFDHAHGRAGGEAFSEAIWGEIGQELPYGANRVMAIIDTGTSTAWPDGTQERNFIIVREDPVRPAHFMLNTKNPDKNRVKENIALLGNSLPLPAALEANRNTLTEAQKLTAGSIEYVNRLAKQFAWNYTHRIFHGGTSQSNIEIDGKMLDYGTMTAQPGYGPIRVISSSLVDAFGGNHLFKQLLISDFLEPVKKSLNRKLRSNIPSNNDLCAEFDKIYDQSVIENFAALSGIPTALQERILRNFPQLINNLGVAIRNLIQSESLTDINVDKVMPAETSHYDLQKIYTSLANQMKADATLPHLELRSLVPDTNLSHKITDAYSQLMKYAITSAQRDGIEPTNFITLIQEQANLRNEPLRELFRPSLQAKNYATVDQYLNQNPTALWDYIDTTVENSKRWFKVNDPYVGVTHEHWDFSHQALVRAQYNSRLNTHEVVVIPTLHAHTSEISFFGNHIHISDLDGATLRYTTDQWNSFQEVTSVRFDGKPIFVIKSPDNQPIRHLEFAIRSANGVHWWKNAQTDSNVVVDFGRSCNLEMHVTP